MSVMQVTWLVLACSPLSPPAIVITSSGSQASFVIIIHTSKLVKLSVFLHVCTHVCLGTTFALVMPLISMYCKVRWTNSSVGKRQDKEKPVYISYIHPLEHMYTIYECIPRGQFSKENMLIITCDFTELELIIAQIIPPELKTGISLECQVQWLIRRNGERNDSHGELIQKWTSIYVG